MPNEVTDVSAEGAQEQTAPPVPNISAGSTQESSAQQGIDVSAIAEAVISQLDPILTNKVDARFKSGKDVRFSKVDEIYEWVKASGGDVAKIQGELTISELRNRLAALEGDSGKSPTQAPQTKSLEDKTAEFLQKSEDELGITLNRDEMDALAKSRTYTSEAQWYQEITKSLVKKAKSGVATTSAVVGATGQVSSTGDKSYDDLAADLERLKAQGITRENMLKRKEIVDQMAAMKPSSRRVL